MNSKTFTCSAHLFRHFLPKHRRVFHMNPAPLFSGLPQVIQGSGVRTVDVRSDAGTKPGDAMRKAMAKAELGDDVFAEDPTVNVMVHCRERGDEMIVGDLSHIYIYEQGGSAQLAGVHSVAVNTLADGTFDLDQLISKVRHGYPNPHFPRTRLVCIENTHNIQGGRVLPVLFLQELRSVADKFGLAVHMDGARLMNAAVAQGVHPSIILQHCHSVSVCLSKGLGAPVGTMLCGSKDFIERAVRARKALGGGMRQAGILAAAGRIALSDMIGRLEEDHRNARRFAEALIQCHPPLYQLDLATVETNIVRFWLQDQRMSLHEFCERMARVDEQEVKALGQGVRVLMFSHVGNAVRAVWHQGISEEDTELAIEKARFVAQQHRYKSVRTAGNQ
ncbi:uncharacterized protein [Paramisgurnus dabryanus]|uniref:uncharacterized protein isoform X2 n=1 Tax=Paramisgurnus dabryanus TaxID=90735 RepID=UPI003CCFB310